MKNSLKAIAGATLLALASATTAVADPINGVLAFSGGAILDNNNLHSATAVDQFTFVFVSGRTGTFALEGILPGNFVTMGPSALGGSDNWSFNSGYAGLWSVGGFTFDLSTSSATYGFSSTGGQTLAVAGKGWVSHADYTTTAGEWSFTSQEDDAGGNFSFSASTTVPDGGTTALLLGVALLGLGVAARRKL